MSVNDRTWSSQISYILTLELQTTWLQQSWQVFRKYSFKEYMHTWFSFSTMGKLQRPRPVKAKEIWHHDLIWMEVWQLLLRYSLFIRRNKQHRWMHEYANFRLIASVIRREGNQRVRGGKDGKEENKPEKERRGTEKKKAERLDRRQKRARKKKKKERKKERK